IRFADTTLLSAADLRAAMVSATAAEALLSPSTGTDPFAAPIFTGGDFGDSGGSTGTGGGTGGSGGTGGGGGTGGETGGGTSTNPPFPITGIDWTGTEGEDVEYGTDGNDRLDGGASNDTLYGGLGDDVLIGGTGDDILDGQWGKAVVDGGDGNDQIIIGNIAYYSSILFEGVTATGGSGQDTYVIRPPYDVGANPFGLPTQYDAAATSVVTDFQAGAGGDLIQFQNIDEWLNETQRVQIDFPIDQVFAIQDGADVVI
ncbi:hypothetical protein LTR94_029098, partial [Friedmanniomyces endolithicus]